MLRLTFRGALGVLLAALMSGCLGGQTGQPSSLDCDTTPLAPSAVWDTTTVQAAAQAFVGTYSSGLRWQVEPRYANAHTPVEAADSAQLTIAYGGAPGNRSCGDQLSVPVSVTLTSSASGLNETAEGTLLIQHGLQGLVGNLHAESALLKLDATLQEAATGAAPSGSFDTLDPNLPGASASFGEAP